ncbi:CocE/NonD family hydrolase [Mycolicibacterium sp. F2034L]|uniref:CocE/NonD family hydrolase n=1 Tax=Mycolicibacterium sp. F2034L TaxID=2926422 RepID=UPI001FF4CDB5|nr:CocE/NonD family hydrolase [Mycolicibacterium sp. F2034L]MCK0176696.1 peptidase S15 [Mycolicibacterium sp. F2034L]
MSAARYVGRVGGLAAALGVGVVIFLASGEASAETADSGVARSASTSDTGSASASTSASTPASSAASRTGVVRSNSVAVSETDSATTTPISSRVSARVSERSTSTTDSGTERGSDAPTSRRSTSRIAAATAKESATPPAEQSPSFTSPQANTISGPTPYKPVISVFQGVITGDNVAPTGSGRLSYTVVGGPVGNGKVTLDATTGDFTFLPYFAGMSSAGPDRFEVLVAEQSLLDAVLDSSSIVKLIATPLIRELHQIPIVSDLLAPVIGRSRVYEVEIPVNEFTTGDPIAFTTTIHSFDGTPISTNYFPALGLRTGESAPTILNGPSLGAAGYTDPTQLTTVSGLVPGLALLRPAGYNVITWDPRGEAASGGLLHLDSEDFEARDVSAIIDWMSMLSSTRMGPGPNGLDPLIGMVGGSYGGGIQLTSAGIDQRIDAIAPGIAWNSLTTSLYPNSTFKTSWATLLLLDLVVNGARLDPQIYIGILTGVLFGTLGNGQEQFLAENAPATVVRNITAPTLFLQGTVDDLFTLQQAMDNAMALRPEVPSKMIWYCGGHGVCLDPVNTFQQTNFLVSQQLEWMDTYVKNKGVTLPEFPGPKFTWVDQLGDWYTSDSIPFGSEERTIEVSGNGGLLPVIPLFGGSGPQSLVPFPVSLGLAAPAGQGLNIKVPSQPTTTHLLGAPQLTFTYSGFGSARSVFAQLVDDQTGRVLGNLVSPIPVVLDGREHTVSVPMENIAYTMTPGSTLTLQIVGSSTVYETFVGFGGLNIRDVGLTLRAADPGTIIPLDITTATQRTNAGIATPTPPSPFGLPR